MNPMRMDNYSQRFKSWMDERGLTAESLAPLLSRSKGTIENWRSQGIPTRESVRAHVTAFMRNHEGAGKAPLDTPFTNSNIISQSPRLIQVDGRDVVWADDARRLERQRNAMVAALKAVVTEEYPDGWEDTDELIEYIQDAISSVENAQGGSQSPAKNL